MTRSTSAAKRLQSGTAALVAALVACSSTSQGTGGGDAGFVDGGRGDGAASCADVQRDDANCGACGYACLGGRTCQSGRCTPAWMPLSTTDAPAPRMGHAAFSMDGLAYFTGGSITGAAAVAEVVGYDTKRNAWSTWTSMRTARCMHGAATAEGNAFVLGGLSDCSKPTSTGPGLEEWNAGGTWGNLNLASAPAARYGTPLLWTGTDLFVYGGSSGVAAALGDGGRFKPGPQSWANEACTLVDCARPAPIAAFLQEGSVYMISGAAGLRYDLKSGFSFWTLPSGTPTTIRSQVADDGKNVYAFVASSAACPGPMQLFVYDKSTKTWTTEAEPPPGDMGRDPAATWNGSELIAWSGGCGGPPFSRVGLRYQPAAPR